MGIIVASRSAERWDIITMSSYEVVCVQSQPRTVLFKLAKLNHSAMISIQYSDIPHFLQNGSFYPSLNDEELSEMLQIPAQCYCQSSNVKTVQDFTKLLKATAYWGLFSIPVDLIRFCDENTFLLWGRVVDEECTEVSFAHDLRSVFIFIPGGTIPLVRALEVGRIEIIEYLVTQEHSGVLPAAKAAELGRLDYLQLLHHFDHPWDESVCVAAAAAGRLDCLQYLIQEGCPFNGKVLVAALHNNHQNCIEYALKTGLEWPTEMASELAVLGNLELLQYVVNQNCILTADASTAAARGGRLQCLQYLLEIGCAVDKNASAAASDNGHLDVLQLLHTFGAPWCTASTDAATVRGKLDCLRFLMENGCPYDESILTGAVRHSDLACLRYLVEEQGVYLFEDGFTFMHAFVRPNSQALQYLLEQGCPFQTCTKDVLTLGVFLMGTRSEKAVGYDKQLLECICTALQYDWFLLKKGSEIAYYIEKHCKKLPLCYSYLKSEGIICDVMHTKWTFLNA